MLQQSEDTVSFILDCRRFRFNTLKAFCSISVTGTAEVGLFTLQQPLGAASVGLISASRHQVRPTYPSGMPLEFPDPCCW
jgi:hypothetical protein